jgi:hypothetical protein
MMMEPRDILDAVEKRNFSFFSRESNTDSLVVQPVEESLYRMSYPGYRYYSESH